ncbi:Wzy polymerase domain-containing protein [Marinobacteraceae bacterium S3BR75-40.1]
MRQTELGIHCGLLALFLLVGFNVPYHYIPIGSFIEEFIAGAAAVIGGIVAWSCMPRERLISQSALLWLVWGTAVLLSYSLNDFSMPAAGMWVLVYWFVGLMTVIWFSRLTAALSVSRVVDILAILFVFSLLIQSMLGVAKFYGFLHYFWIYEAGTSRLPGLINQYNLTASAVLIGASSAVYLYVKGALRLAFVGLLIYLAAYTAILTDTRSVLVYALVIVAAIFIVFANAPAHSVTRRRIVNVSLASIAVVLVAFLSVKPMDRLLTSLGPDDLGRPAIENAEKTRTFSDMGIRVSEARKIKAGISDHFWFGVGPNNYAAYSYQWDDLLPEARRPGSLPTHTHNIFTMVFAEEGLLGLLVLVALMGWIGWRLWKSPKNLEWYWLAVVLGILFFYSNVEYPLWYMHYLVLFLGVCVLLLPMHRIKLDSRSLAFGLSAVVLIVFVFLGSNLVRGYWTLVKADSESLWGPETVQNVTLWQGDSLLGPYATLLAFQRLLPGADEYEVEAEKVAQMMAWRPHNLVLSRKIELDILRGDAAEACKVADKAIRFYSSVYKKLKADLPLIESYRNVDVAPYRACIEEAYRRYHGNPD